ncbi:methyltransferase [Sinomonas cyclohexanicum]|uniref:Methyltransferase n=1 Tax=Sinomonas cyclohexanicum TaxID=322009 RepID=A0ABM7PW53_SINCY|nr:site-specific DNA-methyltransferase [Corynebacterium cyclohexanicum]BCT76445.1 methyltransferase [Corynebacterium cyclohexanicum]
MNETLNRILVGDALTTLRTIPDSSVDMCLTSPPYYRLRNYNAAGQLGLEPHVDDWAKTVREIAREIRRVLVPTGTLWLNLGDTYATHPSQGAPPKSLLLAPERVARLLQEDGWILRNKIIWAKPNPMPSSVPDRLTAAHEVIYLFAKQPRYHFDLHAIRVPHRSRPGRRAPHVSRHPPRPEDWRGPNANHTRGLKALQREGLVGHPLGKNPGDVWTIPTAPGTGSHHAAFPRTLAERCILAGTPAARCRTCHAPWASPVRRLGRTAVRLAFQPQCTHTGSPEPGVVLDPFIGSGTTAVSAEALDRNWIGIELNPTYASEAAQRIHGARAA